MRTYSLLLLMGLAFFSSCQNEPKLQANAVKIGNQVWMNENLNVRTFRNGDTILLCTSHEAWRNAGEQRIPAMVYYDFSDYFGSKHGALYNAWAVMDERGLAPDGWHIPSADEVDSLFGDFPLQPAYLSVPGNQVDGTGPWFTTMYSAREQRDSLGFHAYPAGEIPGYLEPLNKINFNGKGRNTAWWTCTQYGTNPGDLRFWNIYMIREGWLHGGKAGVRMSSEAGHYVRCIKD